MQTRILTTRDADAWNGYLARLPGADVYHTPAYHAAHEANGDGTALCFVAEHGDNLLLHPFMLRDIPGTPWRDIETVYGYSGPLEAGINKRFRLKAWERYGWTAEGLKAVAEFVRMNPLADHWFMPNAYEMSEDRKTVVLDLSGSETELWERYSPTARNKLRKAQRAGLSFAHLSLGQDLSDFLRVYQQTMERNGAGEYYSFPAGYFNALHAGLRKDAQLFGVLDGHRRIATASLFIFHGERMHYHLTGNSAVYLGSGANNLLLHEAAVWGQAHGYRRLHLGGGRTADPDDALLHFKASMSRERRPFYVGKRVHLPAVYEQLCAEWRGRHPGVDPGNYFLLWRKEI